MADEEQVIQHGSSSGQNPPWDWPQGQYQAPPSHIEHASNVNLGVNYGTIYQNVYQSSPSIPRPLRPIPDASHTRNRRTSPPDSSCLPRTRQRALRRIRAWATDAEEDWAKVNDELQAEYADSLTLPKLLSPYPRGKHILWLCGPVGCGKSAISQAMAEELAGVGRLLGSFFFFRGSGERSTIAGLAVTLASQMADVIPETRQLVEVALRRSFGLHKASPEVQFQQLILQPLQAVFASAQGENDDIPEPGKRRRENVDSKQPFIFLLDGLDECDDREDIARLIDFILQYFERQPHMPLRFLIASRVEEHIRSRIEREEVHIEDLRDHPSRDDILRLVEHTFRNAAKSNRVIRSYGQEWPPRDDVTQLVSHAGDSFVFITALLRYILDLDGAQNDGLAPMERFKLALNMDPGLDGLYRRILQGGTVVDRFPDIVLTLALLYDKVSVHDLSLILNAPTFKIVNAFIPLQSVIHIPGDDRTREVAMFHTSLRDFILDESRSQDIFSLAEREAARTALAYSCLRSCVTSLGEAALRHADCHWYSRIYWQDHWDTLPRPTHPRQDSVLADLFGREVHKPPFQIAYAALSCIVHNPAKETTLIRMPTLMDIMSGPHTTLRPLLHCSLAAGDDMPTALDSLQAVFHKPLRLPAEDPAIQRCIVMHCMLSFLNPLSDESGLDKAYSMKYWLYHLSLAVEIDDDGDGSSLSEFLQQPYPLYHGSDTGIVQDTYPTFVIQMYDLCLYDAWKIQVERAVLAIDAKAGFGSL
ncbi:hypothetical protein FA13DRAFT_1789865 [Coprinellus micaceus]|uniref:Nephrocystin 3-like N-terminal domain-containing protein n=1 Tax=Coprinellus micaceus TaxID=71717 RepID=A0A4Y7TIU4_COPMI|nr:hypothetical protein FA13DRAFT_1789865 [Coprinellus micaceus]